MNDIINNNESSNLKLSQKKCVPCKGGILPMLEKDANEMIKKLKNGWIIDRNGHLKKIFEFNDFMGPMKFANKIAEIAEFEGHHPDLHIFWGGCEVEIWTHKINGLNESDFILAAKIDEIK